VVKKKVVLDTNVLISSLLKPKSKARDIYRLVFKRRGRTLYFCKFDKRIIKSVGIS